MKPAWHPNARVGMGERLGAAKNHRGDPVGSLLRERGYQHNTAQQILQRQLATGMESESVDSKQPPLFYEACFRHE